ncbi:hypothetical protein BDZ91DRAFT_654762 [Kalaharituber pfeilii]|nr:hypothetical protein BDZ91DRAFT_654762 [Kalaharituber pfeilii]
MHLTYPKPINLDTDPNYDFWVNENTFPCRGHLKDLGIAPVEATWQAGTQQRFTLGGSSPHYGGSSQVSLSYDQGQTFRVLKSFPGSCPHRTNDQGQDFLFTIPANAPSGQAIFSWSWFNREQEMYHNCAVVEITGGTPTLEGSGWEEWPEMLVADLKAPGHGQQSESAGNQCLTPWREAEVLFPNPGPEVEEGDGEYPLVLPQGDC